MLGDGTFLAYVDVLFMNNEFGNHTCDFARFCVEQAARHDPDLQTEYLEIKNCTLQFKDYLLIYY